MLLALASVKHAPGVTTMTLGLATAWPNRVLLVEADPAGADIPAWLQLPAAGGLVDALLELRRAQPGPSEALWQQALPLAADRRLRLLSGVDDPAQAAAISSMWPLLAQRLTGLTDDDHDDEGGGLVDVVADCGRLSEQASPWPLLEAADIVSIVVRPTVAGVRLASRWLPRLHERLADEGQFGRRIRLLVIGDGPYPAGDVADALNIPLLGALPGDPSAAASLTAGGGRGLRRSRLWRALVQLADDLVSEQAALRPPAPGAIETAAPVDDSVASAGAA